MVGAVLCAITLMPISVKAETTSKEATASFNLVAPSETLKITNATDLVFDDATISDTDAITSTTTDTSISIQELSGLAPGWTLTAQLDNFIDGAKTITGAQLFYASMTAETPTTGDVSGILPVSVETDSAFTGETKGKIISAGGDAATIVTASAGKGYGSWKMTYGGANKVQLKVPAGHLAGSYTAALTYTLADTPAAD